MKRTRPSTKPATATVRCAIYTRKSTDEGLEQEFNSLDAQRESGEAYIKSQTHEGWECLPTRYDDGGFTGGNMDRPALKRLLADIEAGKVDCVVVYKVDRLSRSLLDFARLVEIFEKHYTCTRAIKNGRKACPSGSLPASEIERVVVDQIRGIAADPGLRAEVLRQAQEQFAGELAEFATEQRGLEQELAWDHADIRKLCGDGPVTGSGSARLAELHDRVAQAETRLAELRNRIEEHKRDRLDAGDIDAAFADFDNVWNALSPREQAQVVALLVARVEFDATDNTVAVSFHPTAIKTLARQRLGGAA